MELFLLCSAGMPNQGMYRVVRQWCTTRNLPQRVSIGSSQKYTKFEFIYSKYPVYFAENQFTVVSLLGFLVSHRLYIIDGPNGRPERVHYWRWRGVKSRYSVTHKAGGKALISGGHKFDHITLHLSLKLRVLKVRQIRNDFFKLTFLSKNERTNSTLLLGDLFSFIFLKKVKTPKRHFEINWPLLLHIFWRIHFWTSNAFYVHCITQYYA